MKKILSLLVAALMVFGMSTAAFAKTEEETIQLSKPNPKPDTAAGDLIKKDPSDLSFYVGEGNKKLTVEVMNKQELKGEALRDCDVKLQWYSCADKDKTGANPVDKATQKEYDVSKFEAGEYYFYCRVSVGKNEGKGKDAHYSEKLSAESAVAKVTVSEKTYSVEYDSSKVTGGIVEISKTEGIKEGDEITVSATANKGYMLTELKITKKGKKDEIELSGDKFTMPDSDVTVTAKFEPYFLILDGGKVYEATGDYTDKKDDLKAESKKITRTLVADSKTEYGISYDTDNGEWIFEGVRFESEHEFGVAIVGEAKIVLKGKNLISGKRVGIETHDDLEFSAKSTGSLEVTGYCGNADAVGNHNNENGIRIHENDKVLTVNGGEITVKGRDSAVHTHKEIVIGKGVELFGDDDMFSEKAEDGVKLSGHEYVMDGTPNVNAELIGIKGKKEPETHKVTFNLNYGEGGIWDTETVKDGEKVVKPTAPVRKNYKFTGWYKDEKCTEAFSFDTAITEDTELFACWKKVSSDDSDPIIINGNGGSKDKKEDKNPNTGAPSGFASIAVCAVLAGAAAIITKKKTK